MWLFLKYHEVNRELKLRGGGDYFLSIIRVLRLYFKYNKVNGELLFGEVDMRLFLKYHSMNRELSIGGVVIF